MSSETDDASVPASSPPSGDASALRRLGPARLSAIAVALVVALFAIVLATRESGKEAQVGRLLGRTAPNIAGPSLLDGQPFELAALTGRYTFVVFFATWCPPCVKEHPELVAFAEERPDVSLVSVVFQDNANDVRAFFKERGGTWPVIDSTRSAIDFGVRGVPETYLVDPSGRLVFQTNGGVTKKVLLNALDRAGANQPVTSDTGDADPSTADVVRPVQ